MGLCMLRRDEQIWAKTPLFGQKRTFLDEKRRFLAENIVFVPPKIFCLPIGLISLGPHQRENKFQ